MNSLTTHTRRVAMALAAAAAIGGGGAATAHADGTLSVQPATTSCVIQGEGTPCTLASPQTGPTAAEQTAVSWAQQQEGTDLDDGLCLGFVMSAYQTAGVDLSNMGDTYSAVSFWDSYSGTENPASDVPPEGALVFWGATATNPDGHVAISEGNGMAVSTTERDNVGVHEFSIADRDSDGYVQLGWILPA